MTQYKNWLEILEIAQRINQQSSNENEKKYARNVCILASRSLTETGFPVQRGENIITIADSGIKSQLSTSKKSEAAVSAPENPQKAEQSIEEIILSGNEAAKEEERNATTSTEKNAKHSMEEAFPDVLKDADITRSYNMVTIFDDQQKVVAQAEIMVSPLSITEDGDVKIIVWCNDKEKGRETKVSPGRRTVLVQAGGYDVIVTGTFENGKFSAKCKPTDRFINAGYTLKERVRTQDGLGHILIKGDNSQEEIHAVPLGKENEPHGNAAVFYAIFLPGKDPICGDTLTVPDIRFESDGEEYVFKARWNDDTIISSIDTL